MWKNGHSFQADFIRNFLLSSYSEFVFMQYMIPERDSHIKNDHINERDITIALYYVCTSMPSQF